MFGIAVSNKYILQISVVALVFLVTASNLYASNAQQVTDDQSPTSVLSQVAGSADDGQYGNDQFVADDSIDDGVYDDSATTETAIMDAVRPETSVATAPSKNRSAVVEYAVESGDTIGSISRKFGLQTMTVLNTNQLRPSSVIRIGQTLRILPTDGVMYTVKKGDTLSKIATVYKADSDRIVKANNLVADGALVPGVELVVPDGQMPYIAPTPKPVRIAADLKDVFVPAPPVRSSASETGFIWPTAARRITQYFTRRHTGVDIAGAVGTPIYAADDGVVVSAGWNTGGYGNMILIDHGDGLYTRYAHGAKILVQVGDTVRQGDTIMLMGSTGRSTGSHLHFEVMRGDVHRRANPLSYVHR